MKYILDEEFKSMVDELRRLSDKDVILKIVIDYIDTKAKERGMEFYDMFFLILQQSMAEDKARKWVEELWALGN